MPIVYKERMKTKIDAILQELGGSPPIATFICTTSGVHPKEFTLVLDPEEARELAPMMYTDVEVHVQVREKARCSCGPEDGCHWCTNE